MLGVLVYPCQAYAMDWAERALERISKPPLGLPRLVQTEKNEVTKDRIILGRKLFYDKRLSRNSSVSCASCHLPERGFADNDQPRAIGFNGRRSRRNAPTLLNVAYMRTLFHDGRDNQLATQILGPFLDKNEMANPSAGWLVQTVNGLEDYWGKFEKAFGEVANINNIGKAIAAYEQTLLSANSPFDKYWYGKDKSAIGPAAIRGLKLFRGRAGCARCHKIGKYSALFIDHRFHDTGTGSKDDSGRKEVTGRLKDINRFKTPTLRNIALTAPYIHDGRFETLGEVVRFYNRGPVATLPALGLSETQQNDLVAFLESLTGDNIAELISEAKGAHRQND